MRSTFRLGCALLMLSTLFACAGEREDPANRPELPAATNPAPPAGASSPAVDAGGTPGASSLPTAPGATPPPPPVPSSVAPTPAGTFDSSLKAHADLTFACATASDCAIKDVGNCCGSYPACVNADSPVDSAAVARECADKGLSGVCGYPVIDACVCNAGRCEAAPSSGAGSGAVR